MNERIRELARRVVGKNKNDVDSISLFDEQIDQFAKLVIEEAAKAHLCDSDGVIGKYSDSDRYYFEQLMKKQLGLI